MRMQGTAETGFAKASDYGWCHTDRRDTKKDGKTMKNTTAGRDRHDYFLNDAYRPYTEYFFDKFQLPMPQDDMVYRGNSQDLLFLDDLGLVIRTGPIDIVDMIHPGILQPLYWMPFHNNDHVIAIYPGIQLVDAVYDRRRMPEFESQRDKLVAYMTKTHQYAKDAVTPHNFGHCDGRLVVLDAEDYYFGTKWKDNKAKKQTIYNDFFTANPSPFIAIHQTMSALYEGTPEFRKWIGAFEYHQPLRQILNNALTESDVSLRHEMLEEFYQTCRDMVRNPGDGVALYAPWTGNPDDNKPKAKAPTPA